MLLISLLFILAGMTMVAAAGLMITYSLINTGEKIILLKPRKWPPVIKKWTRFGGYGLVATLVGMLFAVIAT